MRRRNIVAALAVMAGGTLTAAAPAHAASAFSCLGVGPASDNIAPGVEVNVAFPGDFPEVVVGRRFTLSPTVQYKLSNAYLKQLGEAGKLVNGQNRLGGMTFWVPVQGTNTVESRQYMRAVVGPTANTRVLWDDETDTVTVQRYTNQGALNGAPMQDLAGTATLSGTNTFWTPQSSAPVEFSVANIGTLGLVKVRDQWRRALDTAPAPTDTVLGSGGPDVDSLATARPYGNVYWRLRLGPEGRTSLDCASGIIAIQDPTIAYKEIGNYTVAQGGDAGRYSIHGAAAPRFGVVTPRVTPKSFSCIDGLGSYVQREINAYDIALSAPAPGVYTPGQAYTLQGVRWSVTLPAVMLKGLYGNLFNYQSLPAGGVIDQPLRIWVAIQGTNTVQGVQTVLINGRWTATFRDPDGVAGTGDESFPDVALSYTVPPSTWTPTGAGPIAFSVAPPASIPQLSLVGFGHSGDAGAVFGMHPYGSIFVRAETGRYGESIDCLEGSIDFADTSIARSNLGRRSPAIRIPEPVAENAAPSGRTVAAGSAGRYTIIHQPSAPFAIVPVVAPQAGVKGVTVASKAAVRSLAVRSNRLRLSMSCAVACSGTVKVTTKSRYRIGTKLRVFAVTRPAKYAVAEGATKTVTVALTSNAKKFLKRFKKLTVVVSFTPSSGARFKRTLTLKA